MWAELVTLPETTSSAHIAQDRKSTRLNSSHEWISYAVFCLKKKKKNNNNSLRNKKKQTSKHSDENQIQLTRTKLLLGLIATHTRVAIYTSAGRTNTITVAPD